MIDITKDVIKECASNMMFDITEEELNHTLEEFDSILIQMSYLSKLNGIDIVEPLTFPIDEIHTYLREDEPCEPVNVELEMKMAPSKMGNQVKLPKVVG